MTGEVRVLDLRQHTTAGPVLDVAAYLGQIEGGGVQGLGLTLTENIIMKAGVSIADNLDGYICRRSPMHHKRAASSRWRTSTATIYTGLAASESSASPL